MSSEVAIDKLKERFGDKMPTILLDGDYMVTSFIYKTHFYKDIYHDNKVKFFIRKQDNNFIVEVEEQGEFTFSISKTLTINENYEIINEEEKH